MTHPGEQPGSLQAEDIDPTAKPQAVPLQSDLPSSPTRSDKSSDSEGRPVREKLKKTKIDVQSSSGAAPNADTAMDDTSNGRDSTNAHAGDQSTSGSESGRGRLRRKRSREDFEDETAKPLEKKTERHIRKKSRDVTSPHDTDTEASTRPLTSSVARIDEQDDEEGSETKENTNSATQNQNAAFNGHHANKAIVSDDDANSATVSKNQLTHEGNKHVGTVTLDGVDGSPNDRTGTESADKSNIKNGVSTIPPSSGFANTSAFSPFISSSSNTQAAKFESSAPEKATNGPHQNSDDKFKKSGFGSFASSAASPFGAVGNSSSKSPFATSENKLTSFASSTGTVNASGSGFASLGASSTKSVFGSSAPASGGSVFGGSLGGSALGNLAKPTTSLQSWATPGAKTITGLTQKPHRAFGAQGEDSVDEEDDVEDAEDENDDESANREESARTEKSKPVEQTWSLQEVETGEEGETSAWTGRAKLYTMGGEGGNRGWRERGVGPFKVNVTNDSPKRARFVLRADGTHRLLLNAAITKTLRFGIGEGDAPTDGRLVFNTPTADGEIETHLLRLKQDKALTLWQKVEDVKKDL